MQRYLAHGKYQSAQMIANHHPIAAGELRSPAMARMGGQGTLPVVAGDKLRPKFDSIRSDPRFIEVLKKIGLAK